MFPLLNAETLPAERRPEPPPPGQGWKTLNHFRVAVDSDAARGVPIVAEVAVAPAFNPDSVRVFEIETANIIDAKVEWRTPMARIMWKSTGVQRYEVYFDNGSDGETERLTEPAMVGAGDRVSYGRPNVRGRLGTGLHPHPAPVDMDGDGDKDLIVSCPDRPSNGIYLFKNIGSNRAPLFDRAEWMGPGKRDVVSADFNGDGKIDLAVGLGNRPRSNDRSDPDYERGGYYSDVRANRLSRFVPVNLPRGYHVGRDDLWVPVDWDGDGKIDVLTGVADWREYGWDNAYNAQGQWTRGPIHGYVYFHRNMGTNETPIYAEPEMLKAGECPIDLRGTPAPQPFNWFGRGRLDLIGGDFIDTLTIFENTGKPKAPQLAEGRFLDADGQRIRMNLCMLQPRVIDWLGNGRPMLIVGEEDGSVSYFDDIAAQGQPPRLNGPKYFEQIDPYLKSGVLSRPNAIDWNGDGLLDILSGNSAGYIQYFENVGTRDRPAFTNRGNLVAAGTAIRIMAGINGSIQGPVERKWGYTVISTADWDVDGRPDILVNSILGEVVWYRNVGTRGEPALAAAEPIMVEWSSVNLSPEWNWKKADTKELITQWRTTPEVVDWNGDGLPDLVMLDHQGYLALFERYRDGQTLRLGNPRRIFMDHIGQPLRLNAEPAGKGGRRKIDIVDWDDDGDLDLIADSENAMLYENTGSQEKPVMTERWNLVERDLSGHSPAANAADWNGDGKLDLLIGAEDGFFYYFDRNHIEGPRVK